MPLDYNNSQSNKEHDEISNGARQLINEAKHISVVPSEVQGPESLTAALALFYTLKELGKNVNLIIQDFPEKFDFLVPSLDFITSPKNFVISIPRSMADVSQVYYEKSEENLKIHLTMDKGHIKKEDISFYFADAKPDLVITLGVKDMQNQLSNHLDSFGFLLDVPILNIDTLTPLSAGSTDNKNFGKINLVEEKSISEVVFNLIKSIDEKLVNKNSANCILTGLIAHYENLKSEKTDPALFETIAELMKKGANYQEIIENLNKNTEKEISFLGSVFKNISNENGVSVAALDSDDFNYFSEPEADLAMQKLKTAGVESDLLVLWKGHASGPMIKGFFYSKKPDLLAKIATTKLFDTLKVSLTGNDWVFLSIAEKDVNLAKEKILRVCSL